jgi:hypothetical protein
MRQRTPLTTNLLFSALLSLAAATQANVLAATAPAAAPMLLGIQNGLVKENPLKTDNMFQALADLVGTAAGRKVIWEANFTAKQAAPSPQGLAYDFVFSKPPNLTALLLSKGWQLVAVAKSPVEFGTDFIAQACPGKPGEVLLGGPSLSLLGIAQNIPQTCVKPADVWTSPAAVVLAPAKGSLVDQMAQKMWRERSGGKPGQFVYTRYQNAVTDFMQFTHTAVIGAVTPLVSKKWKADGGMVLAHQPMPFWAVLAAPATSAATVDRVRASLLGSGSSGVNKMLNIPGWEAGDPKPYAALMQWLRAKN